VLLERLKLALKGDRTRDMKVLLERFNHYAREAERHFRLTSVLEEINHIMAPQILLVSSKLTGRVVHQNIRRRLFDFSHELS
jgi:hydroxypyruvate isomerase